MAPKPLPAHPSLEQYKKQARELLKAYRSADVESIRRVKRNHPRFEKHAEPGFDISQFALADAQLVIAREHGFESWPKFAQRIEVINSEAAARANPVAAFIEAAIWHGTLEAAEAILAAHPEIAQSNIHVAAILGDDAAVRRFIAADPQNVAKKEVPYDGDALVYLCLSNICGWTKRGQRRFCARRPLFWTRALIRIPDSGRRTSTANLRRLSTALRAWPITPG